MIRETTLKYLFGMSIAEAATIFEEICRQEYSNEEYDRRYQSVDSLPDQEYPDGTRQLSEFERIEIVMGHLGADSQILEKVRFYVIWLARKEFTEPESLQLAEKVRETPLMTLVAALATSYKATIERRRARLN